MKFSVKGFKNLIKSKTTVFCMAALLASPLVASAQSYDDEPEEIETSTGNDPWENSAGSVIGSDDAFTERAARPADANPGSTAAGSGTALRPAAGPTTDATGGPGGNPDVPFDSNMNIVFLVGGIVFAFMVYRRRLKLKAVPVEKK